MSEHSPTPWRYAPDWSPCSIYPDSPGADSLATEMSEEDAAHIVHVVNSHGKTRKIVKALVSRLDCAAEAFAFIAEGIENGDANHAELFEAARKNEILARAAVAKARGEVQ